MKSGNKIYIILLTAMAICFTFFFTTKLWLPDDRATQNQYYDELFSIGDWNIHVGSAQYDKAKNTLTCKIYKKGVTDDPKAYAIGVFLGNSTLQKKLSYTLTASKDNPNYVELIIKNVPSDYYYVTVKFTAQESLTDVYTSSSDDSYGDDNTDNTSGAVSETCTKDVRIDYRITSAASSSPSKTQSNQGASSSHN